MIRRLDDLIAPLSEREFLDCFSRKRRLVVKTTQPDRATSLLPWARINRLIANEMPASNIAVRLKGRAINELMYRSGPEGKLNPDALQGLAAQGVSIVLNHIHRSAPDQRPGSGRRAAFGPPGPRELLHYLRHRQCPHSALRS